MLRVFGLLLVLAASLALGLGTAWMALRSTTPLDAVTIGPWQSWPQAGTPEADPYSRARLARSGEVPLGTGEGMVLFAQADGSGRPMSGGCDYRVAGQAPPARLWTMAIESLDGVALDQSGPVRAIGSDAVLRRQDGGFEVVVSPRPQPGNWISSVGVDRFRIVFRLYDTTARTVTAISNVTMPEILRGGCA